MWNFYGSQFLALEIPVGSVTQFCGIPKGEASFCQKLARIK